VQHGARPEERASGGVRAPVSNLSVLQGNIFTCPIAQTAIECLIERYGGIVVDGPQIGERSLCPNGSEGVLQAAHALALMKRTLSGIAAAQVDKGN
jgi:hypothetical protein